MITVTGEYYEIDQSTLMPGTIINSSDPAFTIGGDLTSSFQIEQVPEPATWLLLGMGLTGLAAW